MGSQNIFHYEPCLVSVLFLSLHFFGRKNDKVLVSCIFFSNEPIAKKNPKQVPVDLALRMIVALVVHSPVCSWFNLLIMI